MNFEQARFNMVEQQIRPWSVNNEQVLRLLNQVKRENFVLEEFKALALADLELPLPGGQAMLFPRIEARLLQELGVTKQDKVLEIGTGSGYVTALLARQADFVYSLEINDQNRQFAVQNLSQAGIKNVTLIAGDGIYGCSSKAPFDKIFVGGSLARITPDLKDQLKIGGRLIGIEGQAPIMHAVIIDKLAEDKFNHRYLFETWVAPLLGSQLTKFKF